MKQNPQRDLAVIAKEYNAVCQLDEALLDRSTLYRSDRIPRKLLAQREVYRKRLLELDKERTDVVNSYQYQTFCNASVKYFLEINNDFNTVAA